MTTRMLIDASQSEETRVVVLHGNRLGDFDYDTETRKQLKGNIYLAKVTRVEPSLQAAFVDYGGNRHGFLAFNEIHPDYYKIPVADREQLLAEEAALDEAEDGGEGDPIEILGGDELEDVERRRTSLRRRYKIQEVVKRGQIMLVQVVKEERGNKGAALTTYLSLPGRYCVLMPNTARGGGISRKIGNLRDRKRLKSILDSLGIPEGMAVIVRTAGSERTKAEIKRDFDYLIRLWGNIRNDTLKSNAPALIYEEANLIKRAIRDLYTKDIDEVLVEGDDGYRAAKDFMRTLMPSHAKRVQPFKNEGVPMFQRYQVESQIDAIQNPDVKLRSGGYLVMHQTEALVAIDVNSGRATRERHIEETALKTNLEAAEEVARQLRLRDLAGLIVIDFIDMEESRNNHMVERRLKDALRHDRARIQVGRISHFGLLEMSRQRLRPSLTEMSSEVCHYCNGTGYIRSIEWTGLHVLRAIEEEALRGRAEEISVAMPADAALYILNYKRARLNELENRYGLKILIVADRNLVAPDFKIDIVRGARRADRDEEARPEAESADAERGTRRRRRPKRRRRRGEEDEDLAVEDAELEATESVPEDAEAVTAEESETPSPQRRKRGRRGGRRRRRGPREDGEAVSVSAADDSTGVVETAAETSEPDEASEAPANTLDGEKAEQPAAPADEEQTPETGQRRRRNARAKTDEGEEAETASAPARRRRTPRKRKPAAETAQEMPTETESVAESEAAATPESGEDGETSQPEASESSPVSQEPEPVPETEPAREREAEPEADAKPEPEPEPTTAEPEPVHPSPEPVSAEPAQPERKRTGWWNRVTG